MVPRQLAAVSIVLNSLLCVQSLSYVSLAQHNHQQQQQQQQHQQHTSQSQRSFNGIGPGSSIRVTVPAYFETATKPQTSIVRRGSRVNLRCDAYGDRPITIEWFKDKVPLTVDARYTISSDTLKNGLLSQLHIKQAQRQDNSIYECVTKNQHGRDRLTIELMVQEEPDSIQDIQVGPINSRSVTLYWTEPYDGKSAITSYVFEYKRLHESVAATASSGAATASAGNSEHELVDTVTSMVPLDQHNNIKPTTESNDWQLAKRVLLQMNNSSSNSVKSITIDKLEPSSKYLLRALAINAIGKSKFSQPLEFATEEEAPEVGPVNIKAVAINSTAIHVSWDEIPRSKYSDRITGYFIGYRVASNHSAAVSFIHKPYIINELVSPPSNGQSTATSNQNDTQTRLETIIQDLKRDTVYEITVLAFNRRGSGPSSDFVVCKTIEMEPPSAVKLKVGRELNDSIFIEWQRDPLDQNPVDHYVLYQEKNSNSAEVRLPGNQTHYRATNLRCGTRYQFYMIAHNKEGKSPPSELVSSSTSGALPVVPSKTSLIKWINSTCLMINLNAFQDNGCRMNYFAVRYRVERQQQSNDSSGQMNQMGIGNQQQQQHQLIGANGLPVSHQALTEAGNQVGGKQATSGQPIGNPNSLYTTNEWVAIRPKGNAKQPRVNEEDRVEYLCNLNPYGEYTIHVAAGNDVGRSEIEYTVLMSSDELRSAPWREMMELMPGFIAYIPSLLVFLLAALSLIIVCLILYTTAIKYYQKFVIMQNQMRATRRAKADEKRQRKFASGGNKFLQSSSSSSSSNSLSRHNQKLSELWADEYEEGCEEEEDNCEQLGNEREQIVIDKSAAGFNRLAEADGDDEDEDATDELQSNSSQELRLNRGCHRVMGREGQFMSNTTGRKPGIIARGRSNLSARHRRAGQVQQQQHPIHQHQQHQLINHHKYSGSSPHQYFSSNLNSSALDSSSIDSCNNKRFSSACMSTGSNESSHGRFQCLNAKQYVKMNEYSMLPTISASVATNPISDIYGTAQQFRPMNGTSPSANSSASNTTNSANSHQNPLYYSTLRRATNMQTYLPQSQPQQQQQQQQQRLQRRQSQNVGDIYGYYMAPRVQAQAQVQAAAAAAAAAAAQKAANEAANSIFVPPQHQIIYSAPNIRRQPSVFV